MVGTSPAPLGHRGVSARRVVRAPLAAPSPTGVPGVRGTAAAFLLLVQGLSESEAGPALPPWLYEGEEPPMGRGDSGVGRDLHQLRGRDRSVRCAWIHGDDCSYYRDTPIGMGSPGLGGRRVGRSK